MPTLRQIYEEAVRLRLYVKVRLAGVPITFLQANPGFAIDGDFAPGVVPGCRISIPNGYVESWMLEFAPSGNRPAVTVDAGYNGQFARLFTGHLVNYAADDHITTFQCAGQSEPLNRSWGDKSLQLSSIASSSVITNALIAAGIAQYFVDVPAWTIGTAKAIELHFQTWGDVVNKVAEVFASPWFEMPNGQVRVEQRDPIPTLGTFREYFAGELDGIESVKPAGVTNPRNVLPRIFPGTSIDEQVQEVCNKMTVRGTSIDQPNGDGSSTSVQITATATQVSPYIPNPPGLQEATLDNELIDTTIIAAAAALRHATLKGNLWTKASVTVLGDPEIFLNATVRLDNHYANLSGTWFVESYSFSISSSGYTTTLNVLQPQEGNTPELDPFACFQWRLPTQPPTPADAEDDPASKYQQIFPDGIDGGPEGGGEAVAVSFDAACSQDFDGVIVSYLWQDSTTPTPRTKTGRHITWVFDPAVATSWQITLTVTDNDGHTNAITKTVNIDGPDLGTEDPTTGETPSDPDGGDVMPMSWIAAAENTAMYAVDGGLSFNDLTPGAAGVAGLFISCTAKVYDNLDVTIIFGTDAGDIMRSTDFLQNGAKVASLNGQVLCVHNDSYNHRRFWAGTSTGRVYFNDDDGLDEWEQSEVFGAQGASKPVNRILTPEDGSVIVLGGNSADLQSMVRADARAGTGIFPIAIGGELQTALGGAGGYTVKDGSTSNGDDLLIVLAPVSGGPNLSSMVFYTPRMYGDGSEWLAAYEEYFGKCTEIETSSSGSTPTTTFETAEAHNITAGMSVLISGHSSDAPEDLNGEWVVTTITSTSFTIEAESGYLGGTGGEVCLITRVTNDTLQAVTVGSEVTGTRVDTIQAHGLQAGNLVKIEGVSPELLDADGNSINGRHVVTSVPSTTAYVVGFIVDGSLAVDDPGTSVRLDVIPGAGKCVAQGYGGAGAFVIGMDSTDATWHSDGGPEFHRSTMVLPDPMNRIGYEVGSSGVYLAAAPTGIFKTADAGDEFWGYVRPMDGLDVPTTWPSGAVGRDVYPLPDFGQPHGSEIMVGTSGSQILKFLRQANGVIQETLDTTYTEVASGDGFAADWHERYFIATSEEAGVPRVIVVDQAEYGVLSDFLVDIGDGTVWTDIDVAMRDKNEDDEEAVDDAGLIFVVGSTEIDGAPARAFIAYTFDGIMVGEPVYRLVRNYNPWVLAGGGAVDGIPVDVDSEKSRSIVFLASASAEPEITSVVNGTAVELHAWESNTPQNFGGDGHSWWKTYYVYPDEGATEVTINCTGALKSINWYEANEDLDRAQGNNGVVIESNQALHYPGGGVLSVGIDVSTSSSEYGDLSVFYTAEFVRTFDDHFFEYRFHHEDQSQFDADDDLVNATPVAVQWMLADPKDDGEPHTITMSYHDTITCSSLCGSARGLLTGVGVTLKTTTDPKPNPPRVYVATGPEDELAICDITDFGAFVTLYQYANQQLSKVTRFAVDFDGDIDFDDEGRIFGISSDPTVVKVYAQDGNLLMGIALSVTAVSISCGEGHLYALDATGTFEDLDAADGSHLATRAGYGVTTRGIARLKTTVE